MKKPTMVFAIATISALISCSASSQQQGFRVKGKINGMPSGKLMFFNLADPDKEPKSVTVDANGTFEFRDTAANNEPALYILSDPSRMTLMKHGIKMGIDLRVIAKNGDELTISGDNAEYPWATVTGNPMDVQLGELDQLTKGVQLEENKIWDQVDALMKQRNPANRPLLDSLENLTDPYEAKKTEILLGYIRQHPNDLVSGIALNSLAYRIPTAQLEAAYNGLSKNVQQSAFTKSALEAMGQAKAEKSSEAGKPAPEFTKLDMNGNQIKLSDYKGKYVLLDFWGSWCGPCRASHPHLKEINAKYKKDGLVIIGIAEERSTKKTAWLKAIKEDGLPWTQIMNDEGKDQMDVVTLYGIKAFPTKILIDPNGNIVDRLEGTNVSAMAHMPGEEPSNGSAENTGAASTGSAAVGTASTATFSTSGAAATSASAENKDAGSASGSTSTTRAVGSPSAAGDQNFVAPPSALDIKLKEIFKN